MMVIHEVLKRRCYESVWKAYKGIGQSRQYLKLKKFKRQARQGKFTLYHMEEYPDRYLFWYADK